MFLWKTRTLGLLRVFGEFLADVQMGLPGLFYLLPDRKLPDTSSAPAPRTTSCVSRKVKRCPFAIRTAAAACVGVAWPPAGSGDASTVPFANSFEVCSGTVLPPIAIDSSV